MVNGTFLKYMQTYQQRCNFGCFTQCHPLINFGETYIVYVGVTSQSRGSTHQHKGKRKHAPMLRSYHTYQCFKGIAFHIINN